MLPHFNASTRNVARFNARFLLLLHSKVCSTMQSRRTMPGAGKQAQKKNGAAFASLSRCHATILEWRKLLPRLWWSFLPAIDFAEGPTYILAW